MLLGAGVVAGWFVPKEGVGYIIIQFVVVLVVIAGSSAAIMYSPRFKKWRDGQSR